MEKLLKWGQNNMSLFVSSTTMLQKFYYTNQGVIFYYSVVFYYSLHKLSVPNLIMTAFR